MDYLLDTNSLIDAYRKWYRPQVFQSVWTFLATHPNVKMTSFVYEEIQFPDDLVVWTKDNFENAQVFPTPESIQNYTEIMNWLTNATRWGPAGIAKWQSPYKADPWLIATAKVDHQAIVTMDGNGHASLPDIGVYSGQEPKINAVATQFGVPTMPLYDLLEKLHLSL